MVPINVVQYDRTLRTAWKVINKVCMNACISLSQHLLTVFIQSFFFSWARTTITNAGDARVWERREPPLKATQCTIDHCLGSWYGSNSGSGLPGGKVLCAWYIQHTPGRTNTLAFIERFMCKQTPSCGMRTYNFLTCANKQWMTYPGPWTLFLDRSCSMFISIALRIAAGLICSFHIHWNRNYAEYGTSILF